MADNDLVWIRTSIDLPAGDNEVEYTSIPRAEWETLSPEDQAKACDQAALDHLSYHASCAGTVVDADEVPDEYRDGAG